MYLPLNKRSISFEKLKAFESPSKKMIIWLPPPVGAYFDNCC